MVIWKISLKTKICFEDIYLEKKTFSKFFILILNYKMSEITLKSQLKCLIEKFPNKTFRINQKKQKLYRKSGTNWINVCKHGKVRYYCKDCKGCGICVHNREKRNCRECHGTSICEHDRIKYSCKDCGGSSLCEHDRIKYNCKDCGGSRLCEHNRIKYYCKECEGNGICKHDCVKSRCRECHGTNICEHDCEKNQCIECHGTSICEHDRIKYTCKECNGSSLCEHDRIKYYCKDCEGKGICSHDRIKYYCKECNGAGICEHGRERRTCKECGNGLCINCNEKFAQSDGYCKTCHPDYIPTTSGVSKIGCEWIDALERELKIKIQHAHYDFATKQCSRNEYRPFCCPRSPVDGYNEEINTIYEFLGDIFHGHPLLKRKYSDYINPERAFNSTLEKFKILKKANYNIIYMWESDFRNWRKSNALRALFPACRKFDSKLEYREEIQNNCDNNDEAKGKHEEQEEEEVVLIHPIKRQKNLSEYFQLNK